MTKEEQLKFCTLCTNRKFDPQTGFICSLTNAKPDFDIACENFNIDTQAMESERRMRNHLRDDEADPMKAKANGTSWLLWIGGLSILNSFLQLIGISFIFGLGITSLIDVVMYASLGTIVPGLIISTLISSMFIAAYYLTNNGHKWAFITAYMLYALDALIFVVLGFFEPSAFIHVVVHAIPLYLMATRYDWKN